MNVDDAQTTEAPEVADAGAPEETVAQAPAAALSLNDLVNIKQIIEVVSQRGAIRANEMTVVGATYEKLVTFLQAVMPAPEATEEAATEEAATEEASTEA